MNVYAEPGELQNVGARLVRPIARVKPHIRKNYGIWSCFMLSVGRLGCGYTPKEAYDEWKQWQETRCKP